MVRPLYRSFRDSYSRDIYIPDGGITVPPAVMTEARSVADIRELSSDRPPQNIILHTDPGLRVTGQEGETLGSLYDVLSLCTRTVPVIYVADPGTPAALAGFADFNNLADALICAPFGKRELLESAYSLIPYIRCMADFRGEEELIPEDRAALPSELVASGAVTALFAPGVLSREDIDVIQRRFIHIYLEDGGDPAAVLAAGANGILTEDPGAVYDLYSRFPAGTLFKKRRLNAHKGFQNDGKYLENSITGVTAAGRYGFDAAEIDVKLTADGVPIVMHNTTTKGMFEGEERAVEKSTYSELASMKRTVHPEEGVDRFDDLMKAMKKWPETPVVIEIKPGRATNGVEELVRLTGEILAREESQAHPLCIMGDIPPGYSYIHSHLPRLPFGMCEGGKSEPPRSRSEAEDLLWRVSLLSKGCAAAYNPEDVMINSLFMLYANFRGLCVFAWSRSSFFKPSQWSENGPGCDRTYISGYDSWTMDHGEKYFSYPVSIDPAPGMKLRFGTGERFVPKVLCRYMNLPSDEAEAGAVVLEGALSRDADGRFYSEKPGSCRVMFSLRETLHFGDGFTLCTEPLTLEFE